MAKAPISVHLHGGYPLVWQELIPPSTLRSEDPLERAIELQLRQKMYGHGFIPDDDVLLPTIWLNPIRPSIDITGSFLEASPTGGHAIAASQGAEHSQLVEVAQL